MWHSCIYTVQALEVYLRAINKPFKNEMSIRHKSCLSGLIRASCLYASNMSQTEAKNLVEPVAELLDVIFKQKGVSVLEWNCFSMMTSLIFMVPNMLFAVSQTKSIVTNGSMMEYYTLQLLFLANLVKAIILFEAPDKNDENYMDIDEELEQEAKKLPPKIQQNVADFYRKYNLAARRKAYIAAQKSTTIVEEEEQDISDMSLVLNDIVTTAEHSDISTTSHPATPTSSIDCPLQTIAALFEHIKMEMREFLRCTSLLFHFITDVEFPDEFSTADSDTYENLCKYLGLQTGLETYFDNESTYPTILESFASHPDIVYYDFAANKKRNGEPFTLVPCNRPVPTLVQLPEDYSDLINSVSDFICPNNEREEMKSPTMCLICGDILCGQSYCCQPELEPSRNVGACTYHAHFCGAEIAPFLRIRDCQIVYLGRNKGCFIQPPYLDEYGETDQGLRRGNPLRLCTARYSKIHLTWLGHGLHEEIARLNDNTSVANTQWHHM